MASLVPRILRLRDVTNYCGMSESVFNEHIRPHLREAKIGIQGVGFDRIELDLFLDFYFNKHGKATGDQKWRKGNTKSLDYNGNVASGTLIKSSVEDELIKRLA